MSGTIEEKSHHNSKRRIKKEILSKGTETLIKHLVYGFTKGLPWVYCGCTVGLLWVYRGVTVGFL